MLSSRGKARSDRKREIGRRSRLSSVGEAYSAPGEAIIGGGGRSLLRATNPISPWPPPLFWMMSVESTAAMHSDDDAAARARRHGARGAAGTKAVADARNARASATAFMLSA